jgi:hypothetical protein
LLPEFKDAMYNDILRQNKDVFGKHELLQLKSSSRGLIKNRGKLLFVNIRYSLEDARKSLKQSLSDEQAKTIIPELTNGKLFNDDEE